MLLGREAGLLLLMMTHQPRMLPLLLLMMMMKHQPRMLLMLREGRWVVIACHAWMLTHPTELYSLTAASTGLQLTEQGRAEVVGHRGPVRADAVRPGLAGVCGSGGKGWWGGRGTWRGCALPGPSSGR